MDSGVVSLNQRSDAMGYTLPVPLALSGVWVRTIERRGV